jgi:GntR family transcriptional regulator
MGPGRLCALAPGYGHWPSATPVAVHMRTGYDENDRPLRVMITILPGDRHVIRYDVSAE